MYLVLIWLALVIIGIWGQPRVKRLAWLYVALFWARLSANLCCYASCLAAVVSLGLVFADWGPDSWEIRLCALLSIAFFVGAVILADHIAARVDKWRERIKPCPHGVSAGLAEGCRECQRKEIERAAHQAEFQRKAQIQRLAKALQTQEIKRLSHAWLSRSESYYSMTSRQFEDAIAQLFRNLGYQVSQTPYSCDGGKDAILVKDGHKFVVECKRYSEAVSIGRPDLQKFFAVIQNEGAVGGFYVNTGVYSRLAREYAKKYKLELYDRHTFPGLVARAYPVSESATFARTMCLKCGEIVEVRVEESKTSSLCPSGHAVESVIALADLGVFSSDAPYCRKCGSPMRIEKKHRGQFWGCSPNCRGYRKYEGDARRSFQKMLPNEME